MELNDELKRMFNFENQFNKKFNTFNAIQNNSSVAKVMEKFNKNNNQIFNKIDAYLSIQNKYAASKVMDKFNKNNEILLSFNKWNKHLNNSFINKYQLPNYLYEFQKQNNSIFKIFEKQEFIDRFIDEFINKNTDSYAVDVRTQEAELNIFGEMIRQEVEKLPPSSQDTSNLDFKQISSGVLYAIFLILSFFTENHEFFKDIHEASVFFINQIDCKGVTISRVNLRNEPNFLSEALLTIPKNSVLIIYDESHNGWVKVKVNLNNIDVEGYVSEAYIRKLK
ncbi:SH3 domain-containing protein [Acinetobacter pittii]|uniref:SH3 domain-containing protein n=1 Tax=Acinetobacter pittii TaxID=48296 RepID=UPI0024DEB14A|nr:SH3 domain-containing protein [Acinetobacter pittii]